MIMVADVVRRLKQPEYIGENRCLPCTVVNLVLAAVFAGAVVGAGFAGGIAGIGIAAGVISFGVAVGVIYLRGYLVPGTPTFTKRYFPEWLLRWFDKGTSGVAAADDDVATEAILKDAGAVTECEQMDDLCLTESFRRAWQSAIADLDTDGTAQRELARILDIDPDQVAVDERGEAYVAHREGRPIAQWESRAAFLADMGAAVELQDRVSGWRAVPVPHRSSILQGLRIFLEVCPACGGPITIDEEVVESCCRSTDVVAATCKSCGTRIFESETTSGD